MEAIKSLLERILLVQYTVYAAQWNSSTTLLYKVREALKKLHILRHHTNYKLERPPTHLHKLGLNNLRHIGQF